MVCGVTPGFFLQGEGGVEKAVIGLAAGIRFETVLRQFPVLAQVFRRLADVVAARHHAHQAALPFEDAVGAGEAALRQQRRHGAVLRGLAGMKWLAHGAEHFAQTASLSAGDGEGVDHLLL